MELCGSTSIGPPGEGAARLRRLAAHILCGRRRPAPEKLAALLLPMVRRAVRTQDGPAALLSWLRHRPGGPPPPAERATRTLTAELVRLMIEPPGPHAETLGDPR